MGFMKISLLQKCGLGNQLFQYAAAMYYANRYSASFEVIREVAKPLSQISDRDFLLSDYSISAPVRNRTLRDRLMCSIAPHKAPLANAARALTGTQVYTQPFQIDRLFQPDLPLQPGCKFLYLSGFFQAWQFAGKVADQLRREFVLRDPPTGANLAMLQRIQASACPVSIHVRRGDYTLIDNGRDVLPMSYFQNAMSLMCDRNPQPSWFVFSDDIEWCRANFPRQGDISFVDGNDDRHAPEDLRLMAACSHHIIANSTFSWWGAWLNPSPDKIVCVPSTWRDPAIRSDDIVPPDWIRVPVL